MTGDQRPGPGPTEQRLPVTELRVPLADGDLAVSHWPGDPAHGADDAEPVVALHGITANGRVFDALARRLPERHLYAPDLRGRAGSRRLPGPYGLGAHVRDLIALLDHLGRTGPRRVVLLGHSMGAFTAALAAAHHPERFRRVLLVDGGLGITAPPGDIDAQLDAVIGPAMRRLDMTFPDRDAYRAFFAAHPALAAHWGEDVRGYVDRDLVGEPPALRSSCVKQAIREDGADVLGNPDITAAAHRIDVPAELLWAERGLLDEPQGLYDEQRVAGSPVPARPVPDTNHYSILLADHATRALARAVRT
ncbi:alpha/beta fold hydrolase [Streptomyces sp. SM14]|uniref:alpha/beta fold hydrolase n=1 Tax=Streptomyces sp. SM14 TaxID=1736045 RepID=UPI0021564B44|nr:alpha/beta hydrolase [Streptomyces sp. SM14]